MKSYIIILLCLSLLLPAPLKLYAEDKTKAQTTAPTDPFADGIYPQQKRTIIETTTGHRLFTQVPLSDISFEIHKDYWPEDIPAPLNFSEKFDKPDHIWKAEGSYFGSFDRGEFGAALFFSAGGSKRWERLLSVHIQEMVKLDEDTLLAVGGLSHLGFSHGHVYLIKRNSGGKWNARQVLFTEVARPKLMGYCETQTSPQGKKEFLVVVGFEDLETNILPYMAIAKNGTVVCVGNRVRVVEENNE